MIDTHFLHFFLFSHSGVVQLIILPKNVKLLAIVAVINYKFLETLITIVSVISKQLIRRVTS